ncbi:MAG: hypothetical protein ICV68_13325 [Pyrinomonadaceae bacterium]|nr:hypothetical protein [Pyrinomonadaceae bacterium]
MSYVESGGPRELLSDVARGTRDHIVWPLVSIPKGIVILYPEFLVFLTDDERSKASRLLSFSVAGVAARFVPFFDRLSQLARSLGLASFDRAKALENPHSFFIPRREIESVRPFWRATHGGIVHLRTRAEKEFYIYQDMHATGTWSYFVRGGWRWHKRLAAAMMRSF